MQKNATATIGEILQFKAALEERDGKLIASIIDDSTDAISLCDSVRYGLTNYKKSFDGLEHNEFSSIWAIPVVIRNRSNNLISTKGAPIQVVDNSMRYRLKGIFGADHRLTCLSGLLHADVGSEMGVLDQAVLLGTLAGDDRYECDKPSMIVDLQLAERIKSGGQPELALIIGSASRYNRMPKFPSMTDIERTNFQEDMKARISFSADSVDFNKSLCRVGEISCLADAFEDGAKMLIDEIASVNNIDSVACSSSSNNLFNIRIRYQSDIGEILSRKISLSTTLVSMEAIVRVYQYAEMSCKQIISLSELERPLSVFH